MKTPLLVPLAAAILAAPPGDALNEPKEDPAHNELRALRDDAVDALNHNDIERLLTHVHPNVVLTAPSFVAGGEVCRGRDGVKAYYDRMLSGPDRHADKVTVNMKVDDLAVLYNGDTAVAWGSSQDAYQLRDGSTFTIPTRWSGTLVKQDGKWLIAEFHVSVNMFDNPVLTETQHRTALLVGVLAGAVGLIVGLAAGMLLLRRRRGPAAAPPSQPSPDAGGGQGGVA